MNGGPWNVTWTFNRRLCYGELHLDARGAAFLCLIDESAATAAAGQAVSRQFGLVGALIGAAVGAHRASKREARAKEVLATQSHLPVEQRVGLHPMSRAYGPREITGYTQSGWTGNVLRARGEELRITADHAAIEAIANWCEQQGIALKRRTKMPLGLKIAFVAVPFALIMLYAVAALGFGAMRTRHVAQTGERYASATSEAVVAQQKLTPGKGDLAKNCASVPARPGEVAAFVGDVPPAAKAEFGTGYDGFPRWAFATDFDHGWSASSFELVRDPPGASFLSSWMTMLGEFPGDWNRRIKDVYPLPWQLERVRWVLAARITELTLPRSGITRSGRATYVATLLEGGKAACEGTMTVAFPPAAARVTSVRETTRDALAVAPLLAVCNQTSLCESLATVVEVAPAEALAAPLPAATRIDGPPKKSAPSRTPKKK